jgi:serine/threonine-protein kinase
MCASPLFQIIGPLRSGTGSRALLGLRVSGKQAVPIVMLPVPAEVVDDPELLLRLEHETQRATALDHPGILRVIGLAETERGLVRAVEYANGETLRRVLEKAGRLPPDLAARVVADVASGVHFAHLAGNEDGSPLVHGDLRPETLMLSFNGAAQVSGYGALSVAPREPGGKRVPGRRMYAAPEQILGGRGAMTPQTDVFLLGLILWEILTGSIPFQDFEDPDQAVLDKALPVDLGTIPEKLRPVISRATAKKGNARYSSAMALRDAIEEAAGPLAPAQQLASWLERLFEGDPALEGRRTQIAEALEKLARGRAQPPPPPPEALEPKPALPSATASATTSEASSAAPAQSAAPAPAQQPPPKRAPSDLRHAWPLALFGAVAIIAAALLGLRSAKAPKIEEQVPAPQGQLTWTEAAPEPAQPASKPAPAARPAAAPQADGEPATASGEARADSDAETYADKAVAAMGDAADLTLPTLDLFTVPDADVAIDGKRVGRSPLQVRVPSGRHKVTLRSPQAGIDVTRDVEVAPRGVTRIDLWVGLGNVGINAPPGSSVFVDGKLAGTTPLEKRIDLYEGHHKLFVDMGKASWQREFDIEEGDHLSFETSIQPQPHQAASE